MKKGLRVRVVAPLRDALKNSKLSFDELLLVSLKDLKLKVKIA